MKKTFITAVSILSFTISQAQNTIDVFRLHDTEFIGTARAAGMGGAMNGLGVDPSSVHSNPANLANMTSNQFSFTPYFGLNTSLGNNGSFFNTKSQFSIGNLFLSMGSPGKSHFFINWNRTNDYQNYLTHNYNGSLLKEWTSQANSLGFPSSSTLRNNFPFDAYLGYQTYLINPDSTLGQYTGISSESSGQNLTIDESGFQNAFEFGNAFKANELLSFGWSINLKSYRYNAQRDFIEYNNDNNSDLQYFTVRETEKSRGTGLGLKLGIVLKPHKMLRHSFSYETANFYWMRDSWSTKVNSYFPEDSYEYEMNGNYDYYYISPAKYRIGNGFILNKNIAFNLDYQYTDFSAAKFISQTSSFDLSERNESIQNELNNVHYLSLGTEIRINNGYLRGGYGFNNAIYTESTKSSKQQYGFGIGFNNGNNRFDLSFANIIRNNMITAPNETKEETVRKVNEMKLLATWSFKF